MEKVDQVKYLGIPTANLSRKLHIELSAASKTLGFLKRNFYLAGAITKLRAYASFVRSKTRMCVSFAGSPPSLFNLKFSVHVK